MYADDTSFPLNGPSHDEIINTANVELNKVHQWLIQNHLSLNIKTSRYMIFSKSKLEIIPQTDLMINDIQIVRVSQFKFLGYYLDESLSWKFHISMIAAKIAKKI